MNKYYKTGLVAGVLCYILFIAATIIDLHPIFTCSILVLCSIGFGISMAKK